jgi:hypothetical protein
MDACDTESNPFQNSSSGVLVLSALTLSLPPGLPVFSEGCGKLCTEEKKRKEMERRQDASPPDPEENVKSIGRKKFVFFSAVSVYG